MPRRIVGLGVAAALAGCVSSGAHDALRKSCEVKERELTGAATACEGRLRDSDGALAAERARAAELQDAVMAEKANVVKAEQGAAALKEQLEAARGNLDAATRKRIGELEEASVMGRVRIEELEGSLKAAQDRVAGLLKERGQLEGALQAMERRRKEADARVAEFKKLIERFRPLIDTGKLRVKIADGRMVVELATDVLFDSGSAKLSDEGEKAVKEVAAVLASVPERAYQVEGHTDNVPISTKRYRSNWELASARAIRVVEAMVAGGLQAGRVSAASFSEFKPAADNAAPGGRKANRRIEIVVVPDLSSLPGFEELKAAAEKGE